MHRLEDVDDGAAVAHVVARILVRRDPVRVEEVDFIAPHRHQESVACFSDTGAPVGGAYAEEVPSATRDRQSPLAARKELCLGGVCELDLDGSRVAITSDSHRGQRGVGVNHADHEVRERVHALSLGDRCVVVGVMHFPPDLAGNFDALDQLIDGSGDMFNIQGYETAGTLSTLPMKPSRTQRVYHGHRTAHHPNAGRVA